MEGPLGKLSQTKPGRAHAGSGGTVGAVPTARPCVISKMEAEAAAKVRAGALAVASPSAL